MYTNDDMNLSEDVPSVASTTSVLDDVITQLTALRTTLNAHPDLIVTERFWDDVDEVGHAATSVRSNALEIDELS